MSSSQFSHFAFLLTLTLALTRASAADPAATDVSFCKEVLILHHSHVDVGYTHPQSMYWELQKDYLNAALDMLDRTENWPDDISKPRWTAEVTAPVLHWLETARPADIARLKKHIQAGRFGISGFQFNTTPLSSAEGLARQLYPIRMLREQLGAQIRTAHQHDVTGIPWSSVDLLLDSGIELLVMGINLHLGGTPMPRPAVYRWKGPSGREILVMNGEHYSMFDQWCDTHTRNLDTIQAGLHKYLRHVKSIKYPYDFVYLSATHAPFMYDNSPPNQDLPDVVRKWNEEKRTPRLRLVTPIELLSRIQQIPRDQIPVVNGDWTDYWNFGCASSAAETTLVRRTMANTAAIDLLRTWNAPDPRIAPQIDRLWYDIHLYNEHTWGAANSLDADHPNVATQWQLKAHPAYDGKPLSDFHLRKQLHLLASNTWQSWQTEGVLVVNPTGLAQTYYLPATWKRPGRQIESHYMAAPREETPHSPAQTFGPIHLDPHSWQIIPWSKLTAAPTSNDIKTGPDFIESPTHKLTFDPTSGKVTALLDKKLNKQLLPPNAPWGFFQLVHERPTNNDRLSFHVRSVEGERYGRTGWKPDWQSTRTSCTGKITCTIAKHPRSATLLIKAEANGIKDLEQRITLHADSPTIDLSARFLKQDVRSPEAVYFAFPINMPADWKAHFDTGGIPTELDAQQIPATCRDWLTVDSFVTVHHPDFGVTLFCPDAPMVQVGDFNFARKQSSIPRRQNPLLLAWPLNNYWETNFRANQPGRIELRYTFASHGPYDPARALLQGQQTQNPPITHPVFTCPTPTQGRLIDLQSDGPVAPVAPVVVTHVKPADDHSGLIVRLLNTTSDPKSARLALPGRPLLQAWICSVQEENRSPLTIQDGAVTCPLAPRQITTVRLLPRFNAPTGRRSGVEDRSKTPGLFVADKQALKGRRWPRARW